MPHTLRNLLFSAMTVLAGLAAVAVYFAASVMISRWAGVAVILAVPVVAWAVLDRPHWVRVRRWRRGQCVGCGYDLTGNVSGVCPECGQPQQQ